MTEPNMRGKAKDDRTNSNSNKESNSSNQPSLASRIQSSATNLAKSAFQPPTPAELSQSLATSTGNKAGQSTLQPTTSTQSTSRAIQTPNRTPDPGPDPESTARNNQAPTFRNSTHQPSGVSLPPLTEAEFHAANHQQLQPENENDNDSDPNQNPDLQSTQGPWKGKQRASDPSQAQYETVWQRNPPAQYPQQQHPPDTYTPQPADGAAVLSLLSDPSFDPNTDPDPATLPAEHPSLDSYAAPAPLSRGEIDAIESFRRGVSGAMRSELERGQEEERRMQRGGSGNGSGSLSGSSLVPDIDTFLMENEHGVGSGVRSGSGSSLRDTVAMYLPGATDWMDVQERYVDDVWGYLEPVLEAAKEEIEGSANADGDGDGPAVRRLKMVLMHMKG